MGERQMAWLLANLWLVGWLLRTGDNAWAFPFFFLLNSAAGILGYIVEYLDGKLKAKP